MAVRRETKEQIQSEVDLQLSKAVESLKPKGFRKTYTLIRELVGAAGALTLVLAHWGIVVTLWIFASNRVDQNARFQAHSEDLQKQTADRLDNIEGSVKALQNLIAKQAPEKTLKAVASLPQSDFNRTLPTLRSLAEQPLPQTKATAAVIHEISYKLRVANQNSAEYWPTVLQFIQFASSVLAPPTGVPPHGEPTSEISKNTGIRIRIRLKGQVVLLDGGDLGDDVQFQNCRIIFTDHPVRMRGVKFISCIFEMPPLASPTPYIESVARTLLASNFESVEMSFD